MSSLSQRLKQLQTAVEPTQHDFSHLSLQQLEETQIDFGQSHVGKKYQEMWQSHQDWVAWFTNRYEKSGKKSHQKFLHYVQIKVEKAELEGTTVPVRSGGTSTVTQLTTKAKTMPKKKTTAPPAEQVAVWDAAEEEFELYPDEIEMGLSAIGTEGNQQEVIQLEHRMQHVETTLSQIVNLLENLQQGSEQQ